MADLVQYHICIRERVAANERSFRRAVAGLKMRIDSLQKVGSYIQAVLGVRLVLII
jgi:hypothetical protein